MLVQLPQKLEGGDLKPHIELCHLLGARYVEKDRQWASVLLDLREGYETVKANYSQHHRRNIDKAGKKGLVVRAMEKGSEVDDLAGIFNKMYSERGLRRDFPDTKQVFRQVFAFLQKHGGQAIAAFDHQERMLGGILCLYWQGTVYYRYGASLRTEENIPVLHPVFDTCIKKACQDGLESFDFWGYNVSEDSDGQLGGINAFKLGFGGHVTEYLPCLEMECSRMGKLITGPLRMAKKMLG